MKYVSEGSAAIARSMERKFQNLIQDVGVIFVSVMADPEEDGVCFTFNVTVGMDRNLAIDATTGKALVRVVLLEELTNDAFKINTNVFMGIMGSACYDKRELS